MTGDGGPAKLKIPIKPGRSYELRITFQRPNGGGDVFGEYLPVGDSLVVIFMRPHQIGLDAVDGKSMVENETAKGGDFGTDKKNHVLSVSVQQGGQKANILVLLDGKQQIDWKGEPSRLSVNQAYWSQPPPASLGLGAFQTPIMISEFALKEYDDVPTEVPSK